MLLGKVMIALCTIGGVTSYAQTISHPQALSLPTTLSLPQCLSLASEHNLTLRQANLQVERARALQGTAWDVDKTELSLAQDPTSGGSPDNALAVSQTIEFPTVYAARHGQLKAETRAEEKRRNVAAQQVRADIAAAYYDLVYRKERVAIILAQDSVLAHYASLTNKRYEAGEARQLENLSAKRLLHENSMELASAENDYKAAQLTLASLVGSDSAIEPADCRLSPVDYQPGGFSFAASAEGALASAEVDVARKALRVAKNGYAPSLSLALKSQLVITGWDPYHENRSRYSGGNFMGFEVGIGVPLFFGATKAKVKAARKEREIAEMEMSRQQAARQTDYNVALARFSTALARMRHYETQDAADAAEIARLGTVEYENGEISYIEYINALRESVDSRLKHAAAVNDYNQAVVGLKRITGD